MAVIFLLVSNIFAQQIAISRIDMMPNQPRPYKMRNWKQVALGYDSLVFNFNLTGQYLPLIWWRTNKVNYPNHLSFGLHTVVGTTAPTSAEAINVLPAVISASLVGIDKSNQNGHNWVLMCEEFFNKRPEENVYLNHPVTESGDDWWYATMPNVFFYQLYDLYPNTGDFAYQFTSVANQWLKAVEKMGGSATPWRVPYMNYRGWYLSTMTAYLSNEPTEPEAAGAIAWLLYHAFVETGNPKYRLGAEWAMEFLNNWNSNPSYELQLPYGVYTAARMNAELGTTYHIEKLLNWCFDIGPLRQWGAIVGNWGGYDCHGLIGEIAGNDYAFAMNTFEHVGALVPLVRYDDRFARAIGKWVLNAANAARLFYPNYLPDQNQDSEEWAHQYDRNSYIAHEALRQYAFSVSPYATGDAISGGWGKTNLALYGSSHAGILGGIIDTTNVEMILRLDILKTDYFHAPAYPTYLYFNPYEVEKTVIIDVGSGRHDLYDAVTNRFLQTNVSGTTAITIPADAAVLAVITPASGTITHELDKMLINGVIVDYRSGHAVANYPPRIKSLAAAKSLLIVGQNTAVYCTAMDRDNDALSYSWNASGGTIAGSDAQITWTAPAAAGDYEIACVVDDGRGGRDTAQVSIAVVESINHAPSISSLKARPRKIDLGATSELTCVATDPDGDTLSYVWNAMYGILTGSGKTVNWIAPTVEGNYYVTCRVEDGRGGQAVDSIGIVVRDFSKTQTGRLIAYYPFNGNAQDASGFGHHGTVGGATLVADRFGNSNSAYYFDGVNDYIRVPNQTALNFQQAITINFWMKIGEFYTREAYPLSHGNWENRWKISITNQGVRWTVKTNDPVNSGIKDLDSETKLLKDVWYNITTLYSGSDFEIYVNGELDNFSSWSGLILPTTYDLTIGQVLPNNNNYNFKGVIDEVRIYDYALSVQEIQTLYHLGTGVHTPPHAGLPNENILHQNYPNPFGRMPFNAQTSIRYQLSRAGPVNITIYDLLGQKVRTLVDLEKPAGYYSASWDGKNDRGQSVVSGIYICEMKVGEFREKRKLILIR
ncbi:MAG: T9SS type A sorting domain-containing protein [candidate division KSB1 bacterium]|nr:T9SS type A sorting domain-containing protein [candidate division KSB1 bacterium]MDZ7303988.1 T9SS type A sorting domain-containing protein [candidate division KSB1 bacterium]MDZ7313935.1 T9SS type A sorting domain-containing protein [candidate division KSB1 bacterium]